MKTKAITAETAVVRTGTQEYTAMTEVVEPLSHATGALAYSDYTPSEPLPMFVPEPVKAAPQKVLPQKVRHRRSTWPTFVLTGGVVVGVLALGLLVPLALDSSEKGVQAAPKPAKSAPATTVTVKAPAPASATVAAPPPPPIPTPAGDEVFLAYLKKHPDFGGDVSMVEVGRSICANYEQGLSFTEVNQTMVKKDSRFRSMDTAYFVSTAAITSYCPQFGWKVWN